MAMKAWRSARWAAAAAAVVLTAAACGGDGGAAASGPSGPALTKPPIKIGNVGHYSGFAGVTAKPSADAVVAWAEWTNAHGGVNGHPVEVVVKDDQGLAAKSVAAVRDLIENEKVVAIVGPHNAGLEAAWAAYAAQKGVPVIGGNASGSTWLTNPDFFPTTLTPVNMLLSTANTAKLAGKATFGLVFCAEAPACAQSVGTSRSATARLGLGFAGGQAMTASAPNYTAQCLQLRKSKADMVFIATSKEAGIRLNLDCARQGYRPGFVMSAQSWTKDMAKTSEGLWVFGDAPLWIGDTPAGMRVYRQASERFTPKAGLNGSGTAGWTGAVVFGEALKKAGLEKTGAQPTSKDVLEACTHSGGRPDPPDDLHAGQARRTEALRLLRAGEARRAHGAQGHRADLRRGTVT
jgi:branched-chain amino acid transport system substrate-binding protein